MFGNMTLGSSNAHRQLASDILGDSLRFRRRPDLGIGSVRYTKERH